MIKVNLLVNKAKDAQADAAQAGIKFGSGGGAAAESTPGGQKDAIIKLLLMLLVVALLYVYERYNLGLITEDLQRSTATRDQKTAEKTSLQEQNAKYLKHQQTIKEMDEKLKILSDIAKKRLTVLKGLERLQNIIPPRVWLQTFRYGPGGSSGSGASEQSIEMTGSASSQEDLDQFLERLDASQDFKDIVPISTQQVQNQSAAYITFVVKGRLGD